MKAATPKDALAGMSKALELSDKALFLACADFGDGNQDAAGAAFDTMRALTIFVREMDQTYGNDATSGHAYLVHRL